MNEAIEQKALELGGADDYEFICECSSPACSERIPITVSEYEHVRSQGTWFFVAPGHQNVEIELVVETKPTFLIVEKDAGAGVVAELSDPRDGDPQH